MHGDDVRHVRRPNRKCGGMFKTRCIMKGAADVSPSAHIGPPTCSHVAMGRRGSGTEHSSNLLQKMQGGAHSDKVQFQF